MGRLRKSLKIGFVSVLSILALLTAAWAVSRAVYPTEAQREAIAEMERLPDYEGRNAFALLWTLDRDVPEDELDDVMAQDVRGLSQKAPWPNIDSGDTWEFESVAQEYPDLNPSDEDRQLFCRAREGSCLAQVREDLDAYLALIDRNRKLLDRIEALHDYDYIRSEFPPRVDAPIPAYQHVFHPRTRHAVAFASGRPWEAVGATCREIATWRRLGARSDNLIARLIGVASVTDHNGQALANMLSELPVDRPLPEPCAKALAAPTIDEISLCNAMRGEFITIAHSTRNIPEVVHQGGYLEELAGDMFFDAEATVGMSAENYRSVCSESERERLQADRRALPEPPHQGMLHFACLGNPIGCILGSIAWPSYAGYRHRLQDYGARLRVLGTLAWMRRHAGDGRGPSELLAARPGELKSPARDIAFGPDGRTLRVPLYATDQGEYWSAPLPPALHSAREE